MVVGRSIGHVDISPIYFHTDMMAMVHGPRNHGDRENFTLAEDTRQWGRNEKALEQMALRYQ